MERESLPVPFSPVVALAHLLMKCAVLNRALRAALLGWPCTGSEGAAWLLVRRGPWRFVNGKLETCA